VHTGDETARGLRDRPLGKVALLALILLAALLVARSCGKTEADVSQAQAIAIAKKHVDFDPNNVMIRLVKRGLNSKEFWAVSLSNKQADGSLANLTVVVIDADTGEVDEIQK
jgi:hypothetical protein